MSLWYATLSRKCLRSLGDKALNLSSVDIKDTPGGFIGTIAPSYMSEHTIARHLRIKSLLGSYMNLSKLNLDRQSCRLHSMGLLPGGLLIHLCAAPQVDISRLSALSPGCHPVSIGFRAVLGALDYISGPYVRDSHLRPWFAIIPFLTPTTRTIVSLKNSSKKLASAYITSSTNTITCRSYAIRFMKIGHVTVRTATASFAAIPFIAALLTFKKHVIKLYGNILKALPYNQFECSCMALVKVMPYN